MKRIFENYVGKERQGKITDKNRNQQKEIDFRNLPGSQFYNQKPDK